MVGIHSEKKKIWKDFMSEVASLVIDNSKKGCYNLLPLVLKDDTILVGYDVIWRKLTSFDLPSCFSKILHILWLWSTENLNKPQRRNSKKQRGMARRKRTQHKVFVKLRWKCHHCIKRVSKLEKIKRSIRNLRKRKICFLGHYAAPPITMPKTSKLRRFL